MSNTLRNATLLARVLLCGPMACTASAQELPKAVAELSAGWVGFADDGIVSEGTLGANVRFYLTPRVGIGPEVSYIAARGHSHLVLTGNLTWDILGPVAGRSRAVTPFLVAGGGLFQTRDSLPVGGFTSSEGAFTAGGGVRALVSDRVTVGVEARMGWEPHIRLNGFAGIRLR